SEHGSGRQTDIAKTHDTEAIDGKPAHTEFLSLSKRARIREAASPSPKGLRHRAMASWAAGSSSNRFEASVKASAEVPTSRAVPASMASGRSVVSRVTNTGTPRPGASS